MKKRVWQALFAAVAMTAWAQDTEKTGTASSWEITGEVKSGFEAKWADSGNTLRPWNDEKKVPFRTRVQFDKTAEKSGVSIRLGADGFPGSYFTPIGHAYGWIGFLDNNKIELSGGLLDNAKWGTLTDFHIDDSLDNRNGLKLEIKPIEGLSFGVNFLYALGSGVAATKLEDGINEPVFGIKYAVDSFGAAAEFVIKSVSYHKIWAKNTISAGEEGLDNVETRFGVLYSAYFNTPENKLMLELDGSFAAFKDDGGQHNDIRLFGISAQGKFKVNDTITPGLQIDFGRGDYKSGGQSSAVMDIVFTPKVGVTLNPVIEIGMEAGLSFLDIRSGIAYDAWKSSFGFNIKPGAVFIVTSNSRLALFYNFENIRAGYMDSGVKPDAKTTHIVQLDLIWTF